MRGTARARDSIAHDMGFMRRLDRVSRAVFRYGCGRRHLVHGRHLPPVPWTCEHSNESTHLGGLDD